MKYNASTVQLYVWTGNPLTEKLISEQTKMSLKLGTTTIDVTSKQNDGWEDVLGGLQNGELTIECFEDTEVVANEVVMRELELLWDARLRPKFTIKSPLVGTVTRDFYGLITALDLTYDMESGATGSITIKLTNRPARTNVV